VRANTLCEPHHEQGSDKIGFVKITEGNSAIVNSDAIVLQRTSNRRQQRRLTAGLVRKAKVAGNRGFVTENHTILVLPDPTKKQVVTIKVMCRLLNTAAVDARFRRMSGTVSVSTKALRELPLPSPQLVRVLFAETTDDERAAEIAYERSSRPQKADAVR
jgi:adenine-specific DNA-methyltransferase